MKPVGILIVISILFGQTVFSQQVQRALSLRAIIVSIKQDTSNGYVRALTDSTLAFGTKLNTLFSADQYKIFPYSDINEIYIQKKARVGKGIAIGATVGAVVGALIGAASYKAPTQAQFEIIDEKSAATLGGALIGAAAGALIGGLAGGFSHKKFIIEGNKIKFQAMQKKLKLF